MKGNPTLGAGATNPNTPIATHNNIKSQPKPHTINIAELAAIAVAIKQENTEDHLSKLTDNSSFCINTIRHCTINPTSYYNNLHKEILQLTDQLSRIRDSKQLRTHIGKVKSHTDIEYNELADVMASAVVIIEALPDIAFT